jgi:hypothetical protein
MVRLTPVTIWPLFNISLPFRRLLKQYFKTIFSSQEKKVMMIFYILFLKQKIYLYLKNVMNLIELKPYKEWILNKKLVNNKKKGLLCLFWGPSEGKGREERVVVFSQERELLINRKMG